MSELLDLLERFSKLLFLKLTCKWILVHAVVDEAKLIFFQLEIELRIEVSCKLFNHLGFRHRLIVIPPPLARIVMREPCKYQQCISKELRTEHLAKKGESLLELIAESRIGRVHNKQECVNGTNIFQTNNHFSDMFSVSIF